MAKHTSKPTESVTPLKMLRLIVPPAILSNITMYNLLQSCSARLLAPREDADPDVPILKQAKADYARLQ
jgi:hypothetical protein